jgi:hypothetical protein
MMVGVQDTSLLCRYQESSHFSIEGVGWIKDVHVDFLAIGNLT